MSQLCFILYFLVLVLMLCVLSLLAGMANWVTVLKDAQAAFIPTLNSDMNVSVTPTGTAKGGGWEAVICIGLKCCDDWARQYYVAHFLW